MPIEAAAACQPSESTAERSPEAPASVRENRASLTRRALPDDHLDCWIVTVCPATVIEPFRFFGFPTYCATV